MKLSYPLPKSKLEGILWIVLYLMLLSSFGFLFVSVSVTGYSVDDLQEITWWLWTLIGLAAFISSISSIYLIFNIVIHNVRNVILWIVLTSILCGIFFVIDYFDPSNIGEWRDPLFSFLWGGERTYHVITPFAWAPEASIVVAGIVVFYLYIFTTRVIYRHAKRNGRNVVRWTTASIMFSPFVTALIYLLTWPEKKRRGA